MSKDHLIFSTKIEKTGFLFGKCDSYGIRSSLTGNVVYRKSTDFNELRSLLVKLCPGIIVPALPKKPINKLDTEHMNRRKTILKTFLVKLMDHPLLRCLDIVRKFITENDDKQYENNKKEADKIPAPNEISQCFTVKGAEVLFCDE